MKYFLSFLLLVWLTLFTITTLSSPIIFKLLYPVIVPALAARASEALAVTSCMIRSQCQNLPLTDDELFHLTEVHRVFQRLQQLQTASGLIFIVFLFHQTKKRAILFITIDQAIKVWLVATIAIGVIWLLGWDRGFDLFHSFFFTPNTWSFPAESALIQLFPEQFWQRMLLLIFAVVTSALIFTRTIILLQPKNDKMDK